jgi:hypothetical protein
MVNNPSVTLPSQQDDIEQDMFGRVRPQSGFKAQKSKKPVLEPEDLKTIG